MKLKRTRKERTCKECGARIAKGDLYGQRTISISGHESINGGRDWYATRISAKRDICESCAQAAALAK